MTRVAIKNLSREKMLFARRVTTAIVFVCLMLIVLLSRLIFLQISEHHRYTTLSNQNQFQLTPLPPKRGLIKDRNGRILADAHPVFSLMVTPDRTLNLQAELNALKKRIPISEDNEESFEKRRKQKRAFNPSILKLSLTQKEVAIFYANRFRFPGMQIKAALIRNYPEQDLVVSALGYVGRISDRDYTVLNDSNYVGSDYIGRSGLEKHYETTLHGKVGYQQLEANATGRIVRNLDTEEPTAGSNLILSLDLDVQTAAKNAMHGERGAVVAIDPENGEIIALYSNPSFDPNILVGGISYSKYAKLQNRGDRPMFNRALRGQFPPASTIKPLIALAGLKANLITPQTTISDPGYFQLENSSHIYHDWRHAGHGRVNLNKAMIVSCDTYFYRLGNLLGIEPISELADQFGFGQEPNIDLDEAVPGVVPTPTWKLGHKGQSWFPGDTIISTIGQGNWLVTPLQLAQFAAAIANRGERPRPHLVRAIETPDGKIHPTPLEEDPPVNINSPQNWDAVIAGMRGVINSTDPQGTGFRFGRHPPYTVAGKTGTAQLYALTEERAGQEMKKSLHDHSIFIAFAPVQNPKIAIAVVIENNPIAPAVARKVMDAYLVEKQHANT